MSEVVEDKQQTPSKLQLPNRVMMICIRNPFKKLCYLARFRSADGLQREYLPLGRAAARRTVEIRRPFRAFQFKVFPLSSRIAAKNRQYFPQQHSAIVSLDEGVTAAATLKASPSCRKQ